MAASNNADQQNQAAQQQIAAQKQQALASLQQYLGGHQNPVMNQQAPVAPQQFSGPQGGGIAGPDGHISQPSPMGGGIDPQHAMLMKALQMRMQQQQQPNIGNPPPQMAPQFMPHPPPPGAPAPPQPSGGLPPGGPQPGILGLLH